MCVYIWLYVCAGVYKNMLFVFTDVNPPEGWLHPHRRKVVRQCDFRHCTPKITPTHPYMAACADSRGWVPLLVFTKVSWLVCGEGRPPGAAPSALFGRLVQSLLPSLSCSRAGCACAACSRFGRLALLSLPLYGLRPAAFYSASLLSVVWRTASAVAGWPLRARTLACAPRTRYARITLA